MYEMKGALSGHAAPDHPVTRAPVPDRQLPSFPVPIRPVTQPSQSRFPPVAQLPRSQFGQSPSRSGCGRLVAQPLAFSRPVTRPPGAVRPPPVPGTRWKARFPGLSRAPGGIPGWCPFPTVNVFLRPPRPSRKSLPQFISGFFSVHTLSTESHWLSARRRGYPRPYAQLFHKLPAVTQRILAHARPM